MPREVDLEQHVYTALPSQLCRSRPLTSAAYKVTPRMSSSLYFSRGEYAPRPASSGWPPKSKGQELESVICLVVSSAKSDGCTNEIHSA
jgi:hypothetical protein